MLHTGLQISHLEVTVDDVDEEVGEPGRFLSWSLDKKFVEQGERLLAEGIATEKLKWKEGLSTEQALC